MSYRVNYKTMFHRLSSHGASPFRQTSYTEHIKLVPLLNMTHAAPSFPFFLSDNKLNTTERGAADVMFKRGTEIIIKYTFQFLYLTNASVSSTVTFILMTDVIGDNLKILVTDSIFQK